MNDTAPPPEITDERPGRAQRSRARAGWLAPVVTASLLGGMALYGLTLPVPTDADPYHAELMTMRADTPLEFGPWQGRDDEVAKEAQVLLNPNVFISRRYIHKETGENVAFLIVQCKDARDLDGHWPPICYPANGYVGEGDTDASWTVNDQTYPGRQYRFSKPRQNDLIVSSFLVIPDGRVSPDMSTVVDAAGNYGLRYFGAAQVQVLTEGDIAPQRREEIVKAFIAAYQPLIEAMRWGHSADHPV